MAGIGGALAGGRYRLVELVGRGGMGRVWRGRDETLDREVAVKEIRLPEGVADEEREQLVQRTLREARAAARLRHPSIITVHDVVQDDGVPWIVMEFVHGPSLAAALRAEGRMDWRRAAAIGADLADALAHAHAQNVVHRDLKPDNVLLAERRPVITDFGIARILDVNTQLTLPGAAMGTPHYMSPEQLEGRATEAPSDLWSLGATLYTAVEGRKPFDGPTLTAVCAAVLTRPPEPAAHAGPLSDLFTALLAKDEAARPTARQAADYLTELARSAPTAPVPVPVPVTPQLAEPAVPVAPSEDPLGPESGSTATHPPTSGSGAVFGAPAAMEPAAAAQYLAPPPTGTGTFGPPPLRPVPEPAFSTAPSDSKAAAPSRFTRRRIGILSGAAVVAAALAVILTVSLSGGPKHNRPGAGGSSPSGSGLARSGRIAAVAWAKSGNVDIIGFWTTSAGVVVGTPAGLTAYRLGNGDQLWKWAPSPGDDLCGMSPQQVGGTGVVTFGTASSGSCQDLQAIDLSSGGPEWSAPTGLTDAKGHAADAQDGGLLAVADKTVAAPYAGDGNLAGVNLPSGTVRWHTSVPTGCAIVATTVVADEINAVESCGTGTGSGGSTDKLWQFGEGGKGSHSVVSLPAACDDGAALASSGSYALVYCGHANTGPLSLDAVPRGSTTPIALDITGIAAGTSPWEDVARNGTAASGGVLYLTLQTGGTDSAVEAVSLATGKPKWTRSFGSANGVGVLAAGPSGVLVDVTAHADAGSVTFATLAASNGKPGAGTALAASAAGKVARPGSLAYFQQGSYVVQAAAGQATGGAYLTVFEL